MMYPPVVGNVKAAAEPHPCVALDVVEEARQGCSTSGTSDQATVQTDRHHLGSSFALGIEHVEAILQVGEELIATIEPLVRGKTHVVGVQRIRNDQVRLAIVGDPVGQIVGIAVGIVEKPALLDDEPAGVRAAASRVPAQGPSAGDARVDLDGALQVLALDLFGDKLVIDPAIAVAGDLPVGARASPPRPAGCAPAPWRRRRR